MNVPEPDYAVATSCGDWPDTTLQGRPGRDNSLSALRHNLLTGAFV
jgi:hypothetical protein